VSLRDLFAESNIDGYDADRYTPPLEAGLAKHGLTPADVLAVTQGSGVWAICTVGIFEAWIAGIFKKQNTVGPLIRWTQVTAVREEPSSHRTMRIVLMGGATEFARIDFGAGGMENTPEIAAAHRARIWRALDEAGARTTSGGSRVDAVRAATAMTASQPVDLSYITDAFLAQEADAPYQNDVMDPFSGATADAIIATYGGAPLGSTRGPSSSVAHRYLHFGHQAALDPMAGRPWRVDCRG
jgi:hypothetical protein